MAGIDDPFTLARFWSKVDVGNPAECWEWTASRNQQGYGKFQGKRAHRVAYELIYGPLGRDVLARHKCDNPSCCNPYHIEPGTYLQNSADAVGRGRTLKGERHPMAKLSDQQVQEIRESNETGAELARRFGVSKSTISGIRTYAHRV